jgi:hypothetical protein
MGGFCCTEANEKLDESYYSNYISLMEQHLTDKGMSDEVDALKE